MAPDRSSGVSSPSPSGTHATPDPPSTEPRAGQRVVAAPRAGARSSRILVNVGFRGLADVGSKIATAVLYILVARKLGSSEFGVYAFALSFVGLVLALGSFGQDIVLTREVARDHRRLESYFSNAIVARAMFSVPPLLLAVGVARLGGMSAHTSLIVLILGLGFAGDSLVKVPFAAFQAFERVGLVTILLIIQRWTTTAVAVLALSLGAGLVTVVSIYCAGSLAAVVLGTWMMFHYIARPRLTIDLRGALRVTREGIPIGIALVGFTVLLRIDMSMLAAFKPSSQVGQYGAAYKLLDTTAFIAWAVNVALLPSFARLSPSTNPSVGAVYQRALKLVLSITAPIAIGAALLAGPIISLLYGATYHRAAAALVLLAPAIALAPVSSLTAQLFYAQGRSRTVAFVYAIGVVENVAWNLVAIPRFSLLGAAAGTTVSEVLVMGALVYLSGDLHGRLELRRILAGPVLGSAAAATAFVVLHPVPAVAVPVAIVGYSALLLAHERRAFPEDFAVARSLVAHVRGRPVRSAT